MNTNRVVFPASTPSYVKVFWLDRVFSPRARAEGVSITFSVALFCAAVLAALFFLPQEFASQKDIIFSKALAGLLIFSGGFLLVASLEFYYRARRAPGQLFYYEQKSYKGSVEVLRICSFVSFIFGTPLVFEHVWRAIAGTMFGNMLAVRLGMSNEDLITLIRYPREKREANAEDFARSMIENAKKRSDTTLRMADIFAALRALDTAFEKVLFDKHVTYEDALAAALWVEDACDKKMVREVWWSKSVLGRIAGIGKDLGYGYTYTLNQYAHEIVLQTARFVRESREDEIQAIENILSRSYEANVLLVGEDGSGKHAVLEGLAGRIMAGEVMPALEHKRLVVLDTEAVISSGKTKARCEELLIRIMNEAVRAGNIILVIENLPALIASGLALGIDAVELLSPYMASSRIQIIALSDGAAFHRDLEPSAHIMKLFEKIELREPSRERALRMLEDALFVLEPATGKVFTYQALVRAYDLADRFITDGAMPEKALDLLDEVAASTEKIIIEADDINTVVEKRTLIPTRTAEKEEKDKLLHMEDLLHKRLINQERAIGAVSEALRRARSGLRSGKRPIGSFLFLGPTGVGKTETAKALAEVYFGSDNAMIRFDMSEYQGTDALEKLIGSFGSKEPGILASRVRQMPFSLLLFDEFEKASLEVRNLFLQILDEGFFSDGSGKKVSMRETIMIATSNAGTEEVWQFLKEGKSPEEIENKVFDAIRKGRLFTPELLNRFDAMVVYHPLTKSQLAEVAMLLLRELQSRLKAQEITFEPTETLALRVAEIGYDPVFGARPMRRAIQDRIEDLIAKKILSGELKRGDVVQLTEEEIMHL